jgi:hypothetical protein
MINSFGIVNLTMWHAAASLYRRHRFPSEIISHTVWLYFRFALSYRAVEEIMAMRGVLLGIAQISMVRPKNGFTVRGSLKLTDALWRNLVLAMVRTELSCNSSITL